MRQQSFFVIFCLVLSLGIFQAYSLFKDYFSDSKDLQKEVAKLKIANEREELKLALERDRLRDFQMEVAKALPGESFQQKNILSQLRVPASESAMDLSGVMMEKGRQLFREGKYLDAVHVFKETIETYPTSGNAVVAHFLIAESYFLAARYPECLSMIDTMMTQYPTNDLTGFIMLRMGQILEGRNQPESAQEVYQKVVKNFSSNKDLVAQAKLLAKK